MKKVLIIIGCVLINVIWTLDLFLKAVAVDSAGLSVNVLGHVNWLYNHTLLSTCLFLFGLCGVFIAPYLIFAAKNETSFIDGFREAIITPYGTMFKATLITMLIDDVVAFLFRCLVGGFSIAALRVTALFASYSIIFLFLVVLATHVNKTRRSVE